MKLKYETGMKRFLKKKKAYNKAINKERQREMGSNICNIYKIQFNYIHY